MLDRNKQTLSSDCHGAPFCVNRAGGTDTGEADIDDGKFRSLCDIWRLAITRLSVAGNNAFPC